MVELGQADRHFAAAGAGGRDDDEWALGLDVIILAVAVVANDMGHIVGVAGNLVMAEGADAQCVELLFKGCDFRRVGVLRHADAAHKQTHALERVDETQHVHIVGNAVVTTHLVGDDILGADDDDDLGLLLQLQKHLQLGIRLEARQHAGGMVVVEKLTAKFQIEFIVKLGNALPDMGRLHRKVFVIIESYFHLRSPFPCL